MPGTPTLSQTAWAQSWLACHQRKDLGRSLRLYPPFSDLYYLLPKRPVPGPHPRLPPPTAHPRPSIACPYPAPARSARARWVYRTECGNRQKLLQAENSMSQETRKDKRIGDGGQIGRATTGVCRQGRYRQARKLNWTNHGGPHIPEQRRRCDPPRTASSSLMAKYYY